MIKTKPNNVLINMNIRQKTYEDRNSEKETPSNQDFHTPVY